MGTNVVVKEMKGHKIAQQWPSCIAFSVQTVLGHSMPPTSIGSESWRNVSTRESSFYTQVFLSQDPNQVRFHIQFSHVSTGSNAQLFPLLPPILLSPTRGQDWFNLYHQKNDLRSSV